ncbi:11165_t:CDS:2 [Entrophospora sp. SA101]|nr:11165_t:CDS:2 [Entrophospora sp. SA101]
MFIPRVIKRPSAIPVNKNKKAKIINTEKVNSSMPTTATITITTRPSPKNTSEEEEEPVKEFSQQQRDALVDEPTCIICGKYGEYICDETDHDVCSNTIPAVQLLQLQSNSNVFHSQLTAYTSHSQINKLSEAQISQILTKNKIITHGKNVPRPILSFTHCAMPQKLFENVQQAGYLNPTPIQMQAIPTILIHSWSLSQLHNSKNGPYAIIMAPTRELCAQIEEKVKALVKGLMNMKTVLLVGGLPMPNQIHRLKQGAQIAVATPGRLLDLLNHINNEDISLSMNNVHVLVLDEVDMMFKMGFENQVMEIIGNKLTLECGKRQTLMFSATIPTNIEILAKSLLNDHIRITVGNIDDNENSEISSKDNRPKNASTTKGVISIPVKQTILWVENKSKKKQLFSILNDPKYYRPPIIIFVESKMGADLLSGAIEKKCFAKTASIHGDKPQEERIQILNSFLEGEYEIIVSTGVLSRGLDLPNVKMVVNFDMAVSIDEYIHQCGRAGGYTQNHQNPGWAITFINEDHKHHFKEFVTMLKSQPSGRVTPLPSKLLNHGYTLYGNNNKTSNKHK